MVQTHPGKFTATRQDMKTLWSFLCFIFRLFCALIFVGIVGIVCVHLFAKWQR